MKREREKGTLARTNRQTVEQFLTDWIEKAAKSSVRPATFASYAVYVNRHVIPALGARQLGKLTAKDVHAFLTDRLEAGLSPKTVKNIHGTLRRAVNQAMRWGLVGRNVVTLVDPPRVPRHEPRAITPDEARAILRAVRDERLAALYVLAVYCGLRQGELLGLRWADVNLEQRVAHIRTALHRADGRLRLAEPKTAQSRRAVALPFPVVAALKEHRKRQLEERLKAGDVWQDTGLVFTTGIGTPIDPRGLIRHWHRVRQRIGKPSLRFHDLRHGCATLWLAGGEHPKVVQELLGHATIGITMDTYSHVIPATHREAASRVARLIAGATG